MAEMGDYYWKAGACCKSAVICAKDLEGKTLFKVFDSFFDSRGLLASVYCLLQIPGVAHFSKPQEPVHKQAQIVCKYSSFSMRRLKTESQESEDV